jgi:hypothetical protein
VMERAGDDGSQLLTAEISPEKVADIRDLWGFFRTRRPDAYGALAQPLPGGEESGMREIRVPVGA